MGIQGPQAQPSPQSSARAVRRARAQVRDLALCNPFTHFVTLTLDQSRVDRYDMIAITRKLNAWLSNQVQRRGLKYVLVPERHKDGAIHFHGFFNDVLDRVDSGTMIPPGGGKPRKPRSRAQRAAWEADGGRVVWNLPGWSLGFTTALELVGEYSQAVNYVCKYIGKQQDPGRPAAAGTTPAGTWPAPESSWPTWTPGTSGHSPEPGSSRSRRPGPCSWSGGTGTPRKILCNPTI